MQEMVERETKRERRWEDYIGETRRGGIKIYQQLLEAIRREIVIFTNIFDNEMCPSPIKLGVISLFFVLPFTLFCLVPPFLLSIIIFIKGFGKNEHPSSLFLFSVFLYLPTRKLPHRMPDGT